MSYRNTTLYGDCRDSLRKLGDDGVIVNCVVTSPPYWSLRSYLSEDHPMKGCELGQESTPEEFLHNMVEVFGLVRDVLAPDGTLWVNIGDTYNGSGGSGGDYSAGGNREGQPRFRGARSPNLKPKDLCMIPAQLAIALRDDGWWLRSECVWHKPNVLPESATDRPTRCHEMVYMFSRNKTYFHDENAVRERQTGNAHSRGNGITPKDAETRKPGIKANESFHESTSQWHESSDQKRRLRTVWTIPVQPYSGSHFATFPPRIPEIAILAGTSQYGHCPKCGRGWRRIVEKGEPLDEQKRACGADSSGGYHGQATKDYEPTKAQDPSATKARILEGMRERVTVGWEPTCKCGADPVPGLVLDPFFGSGTTGLVAERLGRHWIGLELNDDYKSLIDDRTAQRGLFSHA